MLDVDGDAQVTGKALFTDLREGKMTYPLLVALERDPTLAAAVLECAQKPPDQPLPEMALRSVLAALHNTGAIEACRDKETMDVFMLHPKDRVSEVQRRQMTTVAAAPDASTTWSAPVPLGASRR